MRQSCVNIQYPLYIPETSPFLGRQISPPAVVFHSYLLQQVVHLSIGYMTCNQKGRRSCHGLCNNQSTQSCGVYVVVGYRLQRRVISQCGGLVQCNKPPMVALYLHSLQGKEWLVNMHRGNQQWVQEDRINIPLHNTCCYICILHCMLSTYYMWTRQDD